MLPHCAGCPHCLQMEKAEASLVKFKIVPSGDLPSEAQKLDIPGLGDKLKLKLDGGEALVFDTDEWAQFKGKMTKPKKNMYVEIGGHVFMPNVYAAKPWVGSFHYNLSLATMESTCATYGILAALLLTLNIASFGSMELEECKWPVYVPKWAR